MSVDELGKWLAAVILEQPLFSKPVYLEKLECSLSDAPLMVLSNVRKSSTRDAQNIAFELHINPYLLTDILELFFDKDDPEANRIGAHCFAMLDRVVSQTVEDVLHRSADMPFNAELLGGIFPAPDPLSFRKEKAAAMSAIYDRLTKKGTE